MAIVLCAFDENERMKEKEREKKNSSFEHECGCMCARGVCECVCLVERQPLLNLDNKSMYMNFYTLT